MDDLTAAHRRTVMIWGAVIGSQVMYLVVGEVLILTLAPFRGLVRGVPLDVLRWVLAAVAAVELALVRVVASRVSAAIPLPMRLQNESILRFALCATVGVYGLVLFLIAGARSDLYGFVAVAVIALGINFPRLERWQERAAEQARRTG